jgi:NAD(P)-dependent dehydrogenase (short-subunit alcohol dehydrogenase family)
MRLADKVAVITGASRGVGRAIALEFAREGAAVVLTARSTRELPNAALPGTIEEVAEEVVALGAPALAVRADIAKDEEIATLYERTMDRFGRCDLLVNNAAVQYSGPHFVDLPLEHWDEVLAVNLRAPVVLCTAFLPQMITRGSGYVLNIGSAASAPADRPHRQLAYATSKAALNRFTQGLGFELRSRNVAVNCLEIDAVVLTDELALVVDVLAGDADPALLTEARRAALPTLRGAIELAPKVRADAVGRAATWLVTQPPELTAQIFPLTDLLQQIGVISVPAQP